MVDRAAEDFRTALGFVESQDVETLARAAFVVTDVDQDTARVAWDRRARVWRMFAPMRPDAVRSWQVAKAVAEWLAGEASPRLASALLLPRDLVLDGIDFGGYARTAAALRAPVAAVYLREGELRTRPTALVWPRESWSRKTGDPHGRFPPEKTERLHRLADMPTVGVEKVRLNEREVVLRAS